MVNVARLRNLMLAIAKHPSVNNLGLTKLWKLIYFVDVTALREHGSTVTGSEFIKYPHGPVPSRGERVLKAMRREGLLETEQGASGRYMQTYVTALSDPEMSVFSAEEAAIIDGICRTIGGKTAKELSELSHEEPAWALAGNRDELDPRLMFYGRSEDPEGL